MEHKSIAMWALRAGLAFAFLYPAVASLITPSDWVGFVPREVREIFGAERFLLFFSFVEILIGVGILFLRRPMIPAVFAIGILSGVLVFNLGSLDLVFRDVSMIGMAAALIALTSKTSKNLDDKEQRTV